MQDMVKSMETEGGFAVQPVAQGAEMMQQNLGL